MKEKRKKISAKRGRRELLWARVGHWIRGHLCWGDHEAGADHELPTASKYGQRAGKSMQIKERALLAAETVSGVILELLEHLIVTGLKLRLGMLTAAQKAGLVRYSRHSPTALTRQPAELLVKRYFEVELQNAKSDDGIEGQSINTTKAPGCFFNIRDQ